MPGHSGGADGMFKPPPLSPCHSCATALENHVAQPFFLEPPPPNDMCGTATPLTCGSTVPGSTLTAYPTSPSPGYCSTLHESPDVWYSIDFVGELRLKTCGASFDTKISVFTGSCGELCCVGGQDDSEVDGCNLQNDLTVSVDGPTYIMVHGYGHTTGDFDLEVICGMHPTPKILLSFLQHMP